MANTNELFKELKVIGKIKIKNGYIAVRIIDFKGTPHMDIRKYVETERFTGWGKGIMLNWDESNSLSVGGGLMDKAFSELDAMVSKKEKAIKKSKLRKK